MGAAMRGCVRLGLLVALAGLVFVGGAEVGAWPGTTERVSVDSGSVEGDRSSEYPAISADGRYVAFHSSATNLVANDTNGRYDVFVHDRQAGTTERVSVSSAGAEGNSDSLHPAIGGGGRYVAFDSNATNLVSGDTNGWVDVFVRDRQTNITERVSVSSAEVQGNNTSWYPAISNNGRYVAFQSFASNLVSGDTNNFCDTDGDTLYDDSCPDVFVRDRQAGTTVRVSVASAGTQGNAGSGNWLAISSDGRYVAFASDASNLVSGDTNNFCDTDGDTLYDDNCPDVFVRDRDTDGDGIFDEAGAVSTTRVSVDSSGAQSNGESYYAAISADGRFVAFGSSATNLVMGDTNGYPDVFVRDRQAGATTRVSVDSAAIQGNKGSFAPAISGNGGYVAFHSLASNLVTGDTNEQGDVFVRDRQAEETIRVSVDNFGGQGDGESLEPAINGDGRSVAFGSSATNLVAGDTNGVPDVFVRERSAAVGGIAELPDVSGSSAPDYVPLVGVAAMALALLAAAVWFAGRRRPGGAA